MPDAPRDASETDASEASDARYLVTARKYRPARFSELVAQGHVTDTLKNALRLDRLAHAYLFSGPRGVGKTTAARILAKAINCTTPLSERPDEAEPCRACESCRSFEEGRSLGIFELDAASNNKVDDIRELRETVRVPPQGTKKKVYIIDEVHMLSNQAFNALLKTLEEPPPHVLFIFATTEPHKVLPTILSRCQRFDFRRVPAGRIARHLRWICDEEGVDADEGSLMLLARKGDGALRDALSAFDQAVSLCGDTLRHDELAQALGVVDADLYFHATGHVLEGESAGMLRLVEDVVGRGYDLHEFLNGLSEHLRNLMVARTMEDTRLIEATDAMRERYEEAAPRFGKDDLLRLLMVAGEAEEDVKQSAQPRLRLEMALLKMASLPHAADLQEALTTLRRLEQRADDGDLPDLSDGTPGGTPDGNAAPSGESAAPEENATPSRDPSATPADASGSEEKPGTASSPPGNAYDAPAGAGRVQESSPPDREPTSTQTPSTQTPSTQTPSTQTLSTQTLSTEPAATDAQPTEVLDEENSFSNLNPDAPSPGEPNADETASSARDAPGGDAPSEPTPSEKKYEKETEAPPAYDDLFGAPALSGEGPSSGSGGGSSPQNNASSSDATSSAGTGAGTGAPAATPATGDGSDVTTAEAQAPGSDTASHSPAVEQLRAHWDRLVEDVRTDRIDLASCLRDAAPMELNAGTLTVAVPNQFSRRFLLDQESFLLGHVERHLPERVAVPSALRLTLDAPSEDDAPSGDAPADPHAVMQKLREEHPVVRTIFEEFGGEMAW